MTFSGKSAIIYLQFGIRQKNTIHKEAFMKETLEKLWNEYLLEECAVIDTYEERKLTQRSGELHEKANALLSNEQKEAVEKYVNA